LLRAVRRRDRSCLRLPASASVRRDGVGGRSIASSLPFLEQAKARYLQQTGDPVAAQQLAWQALQNLREQQSSALAYFDCFWLFAVVMFALIFVVFVMKRSVAEKGARAGAA
jgi:DHA2 family multidrug resistance protein